jgi:CRP-like cAMP-binding protein
MEPILLNSPLFKGLNSSEVNDLFNSIAFQVKNFKSGEMMAQAGESVDKAILLLEGRLQGEMVDFAGNSLKIEELEPPQMVAAAFLYGPNSTFPVNLSAKTDGKILIILKRDFTLMLSLESRVMVNFINIVSGKSQFLSGKITFLSLRTIKEKIAFYLLQTMKERKDNFIGINQTQTMLADLFGVTRPSLTRTILEMEKQGILRWSREQVEILNPGKLKSILGK